MPIVSSVITGDERQRDGRRWVGELHTDHLGVQYPIRYLAEAAADIATVMRDRVAVIEDQLRGSEIAANVAAVMLDGSAASYTLAYSTAAQNFAALRAAYQGATRTQAIMVGDFLASLTNGQIQTAFGLTAGQVATLRTNKLTPAAAAAATIRAAAGA